MGTSYNKAPSIAVLYGGISQEREVSLKSGCVVAAALRPHFKVRLIDIKDPTLPCFLKREVILPMLHGTFGEDGTLQKQLETKGFFYAGSDSDASELCMDKARTKKRVQAAGLTVAPSILFDTEDLSVAATIAATKPLGDTLVVKPNDQGSSVGLFQGLDREAFQQLLPQLSAGRWIVEKHLFGREITVGILEGKALGLVEIVPEGGIYDFSHKYTKGLTRYEFPAAVAPEIATQIKQQAEIAFAACGCRDFARVDFILTEQDIYFLEINTLPGLTKTSLLPKSAACCHLTFSDLCYQLVLPVLRRFHAQHSR